MTLYIREVHYGDANHNNSNDIVEVKYSYYPDSANMYTNAVNVVISNIKSGYKYYTAPKCTHGAEVEVYDTYYIRTKANSKECDNLENLPRY